MDPAQIMDASPLVLLTSMVTQRILRTVALGVTTYQLPALLRVSDSTTTSVSERS